MAEALGIGRESARVLTQRKRWPRRAGNDGKARIGVPDEEIAARNYAPHGPRSDARNASPNAAPDDAPNDTRNDAPSLELIELRVLNTRLEAQIEALRAIAVAEREQTERERQAERERSERERQLLEKAISEARAERDRWAAQAERLALTALKPFEQPQAEFVARIGRLASGDVWRRWTPPPMTLDPRCRSRPESYPHFTWLRRWSGRVRSP